jgi:hypothetical protein
MPLVLVDVRTIFEQSRRQRSNADTGERLHLQGLIRVGGGRFGWSSAGQALANTGSIAT